MMNPFPPEGNMQHGWEVIDRDAAPSIKCKYELDEDEEDREEALQQCAADAWLWLNELPAGEYGVQFGVQYELPDVQFVGIDVPQSVQRQRNFQWNDWKNRRVPSPPAEVETIADDLLNELANKYGSDEWNPVTVYMRVRRGTGGIVLRDLGTATKERRLQEKNVRDGAKRTQKESAQRQRRAGQRPDGTTAQRNATVRRVQKTGRPQQRKLDPTGLVRAVALVLCGDTPNSAAHTRKIDALLNVVSSLLDDEAKLAALEAARGIAITVWSPEGDQLRTPPVDLDEGATAVHLQRDADGMYALVTDAQRYLARHAEHACRNPHCTKGEHGNPFRAARASKVHEHEQRQCCLKCPQCGEDFADADDFEAGLEALERHVEQSKSVPCVGKAEREKRAIAQNLPGLVPFSIAVDIEAVPEAGEAPRGVVFRMDEAGDPLPIAKLGFAGARRSLIVRYETCTVTPCDTSEKEPTAVLHCTPDARPDDSTMDTIATLTLGDVFEVVWSDGTRGRYVNAIENARTGGITTAFRTSACTGGVTTDFRAKPHPIAILTATIEGLEVSYAETRRARECDDAAAPVKATFACTPNAPPDALALRAIASLQHGDIFEMVLPTDEDHPEGMRKRFVNAVGADRHTAGDQLTTMVCWKLSPPLVDHLHRAAEKERLKREMNHRPNATDFPRDERWTCTDAARGAFCTVYRQDADGVPLLDHHILAAFIGFLDALDGRLRTIAERGARWHARCKLLAEWCYRYSSAEPRTHADFRAWSAGKRLDFWKQYEMKFVNAALLEAGDIPLSNNTRKGEPHVDEHLSVCGTGSGVLALRSWLTDEPQRAEYERLVVNKLKDVQQERVTVLAHNGSGYDYFKFLKSLLRLQRAADVDALESNNRLINLEYKKRYTFHDSMLQILGRLDKLARDFGARVSSDTNGLGGLKGCACHGWFATTADREANWPDVDFTGKPTWWLKWSDADREYKPARRFFVERTDLESATAKLEGFDVMLSPEDYKTLPGKDPEGLYDGPVGSKWNTFRYFATYCAQDVHVLAESVWEKWRTAVLATTRYDGRDDAHPQLTTLPATVLSLDPGATTGYSLMRKEVGGSWRLLACGSVEGLTAQNAEQLLHAAPTLLGQARVTLGAGGAACVGTVPVPLGSLLTPATARVVELQPYGTINAPQWQRMEALETAFDCARVDSGYPKHLDPDKTAGMTHADNKEWALRTAAVVAAERGMVLPTSVSDDACDAFLQGVWWLEKHTPSALGCMECDEEEAPPLWAPTARCLCCVRRFHSAGLDPSACLTISQLTTRAYKAPLFADLPPRRVEDEETRIVVYEQRSTRRARYMPEEGLTMLPKAEDQMNRKAMRGGRTETGATLYEISNPCRCTEIDEETGRRLWIPLCGQSVKPDSCPSCDSSGVSATRLNFECDACEWSMRRPKAGAPERIESWDVTSLYPSCLMGDLPVPNGEWLAPETLTALDVESYFFSPEGEAHFWCITCDVEPNPACTYPILSTKRKVSTDDASAKLVFDNHPIRGACSCGASPPCYVPHGPECTRTGCDLRAHGEGTLCAEHTGVASACTPALTVCCPELRIALRNGWRITKLHAALKYKKARYMNEYITTWAAIKNHQDTLKKAKNHAYNPAMRAAAKLILNSIYGRTLMRERETIAELLTAAQRIEKLKDDAARARVLTEQQLDGGAWLVTSHKAWKPASGLPPCIGVFCLSLSKAVLYNGVTRAVAAGATWLGGDTDAVTLALPHGVEFPLELQGSAFGLFTRDYAEQLLTAWSNPFLKGYAFNITHDHAAYLPAAIKELRTVVLAWPAVHTANERQLLDALDSASRLDSSSLSRDVLQQRDVRHALVATLHEDKGAVLINALLDLIGPEVMKMKGARVSDNLGALSYERYSALASGEVQQLTVVKSQLLKLGWCGQRSMAFTHAPIHVRGQNDKRKVLALESPFVELPPGQLPRAGIKRRLTVPWGYDPLPRTVAQVQLCIDAAHELSAVAARVGEALDWSTLKAEQLDQLKVVWARVRSEGGSASVASTRTGVHCGGCAPFGFDVKRRRTCTHAQRETQWTTLAGGATPCTRRASDGTVDASATLVEALHALPIPLRSEEQHKTLSPSNKMAPRKSVVPRKCTAEFIMFMVRSAVTDSKSVHLEPAKSAFERQLRRGIRKRTGSKRSTLRKGAQLEALCRQLFPDALLSGS